MVESFLDGYKDIFITNGVIRNNLQSDLADLYDQKLDSLREIARNNNRDPKELIDVFDFVDLAPMDAMPNYVYKNMGDLTFSNQGADWGLDFPTTSNGAAYADFDLDGDVDLVVNNANAKAGLYRNNTVERAGGNYIRFKLLSENNNPLYGAKVTIYKGEEKWQNFHIVNLRGFRSVSERIAHFGIGLDDKISKASIVWPDGRINTLTDLDANKLYTVKQAESNPNSSLPKVVEAASLFQDVTVQHNPDRIRHEENTYDDFSREPLLPYKLSHTGPAIAVGDVNADQLEDFYFGGSAGFRGRLYIQKANGMFQESNSETWELDMESEDADACFIDVDGDTDLDLIVSSGGSEYSKGDDRLKDRLYRNNGSGSFRRDVEGLPANTASSSRIASSDFDNDGDPDVFIGGRQIPGHYPYSASSQLLENRNGSYIDVTRDKAPELIEVGMVTSACWTDYDNDGKSDIIVVGEWMPITIFRQTADGRFEKFVPESLENTEGWYYEIHAEDMDNDGDDDFIVGNLGMNYSYKATPEAPLEVYAGDFDLNGTNDIVFSYSERGVSYPVIDRNRAIEQMPTLEKVFSSFAAFSRASMEEIYGEALNQVLRLKARNFASVYIENLGSTNFLIKPLPNIAQVATTNTILVKDFDLDDKKDILIAGNNYQTDIVQPRIDAGTGVFLKGDGAGNFLPLSIIESGFYTPLDVRNLKFINIHGGQMILVGNNNSYLQVVKYVSPSPNL